MASDGSILPVELLFFYSTVQVSANAKVIAVLAVNVDIVASRLGMLSCMTCL